MMMLRILPEQHPYLMHLKIWVCLYNWVSHENASSHLDFIPKEYDLNNLDTVSEEDDGINMRKSFGSNSI